MRIVFIGSVDFSAHMLEKLISMKANIVGVCTRVPHTQSSDLKDLSQIAHKNTIKCYQTDDINTKETRNWIAHLHPDIIFCFGWSALIKKELLELPPMGIIGFHPTKLPKNRGRHPLIWSLVLGLEESACSFFFMQEGADNGDILSQEDFTIDYKDNAQTLYKKVIEVASRQLEEFVPQLQNNRYTPISQNHQEANVWRKRSYKDGIIDFRMHSRTIYNLVRALSHPYPGATLRYKENDIKIWKVKEVVLDMPNIEPGKVLHNGNGTLLIKTANGAIEILEHEFVTLPQQGEYL